MNIFPDLDRIIFSLQENGETKDHSSYLEAMVHPCWFLALTTQALFVWEFE